MLNNSKYLNITELLSLDDDMNSEYYNVAIDISLMFTGHYCSARASIMQLHDRNSCKVTFGEKIEDMTLSYIGKKDGYNYRMRLFS